MKSVTWTLLLALAVTAMAAMTIGCTCQKQTCSASAAKCAKAPALCGSCGQIKGTDACCDPDAVKCANCGLDKGSPGCCKIN